ncbi:hypothetical protein [Haladaptatus cibarius]|uniref:hypothetical protein n=1 Tax=Haladaptatus cibarius TaxID=453847 RepID=UPI000678E5E4|nr:hypothetical protein [Haladaptatus cibarius]
MNGYSDDRNDVGFGNASGGHIRTDGFVITNRYREQGETWLVVSSVSAPLVEMCVRQSDVDAVEG